MKLGVILAVLMALWPAPSAGVIVRPVFDPGYFAAWNHLIVEGKLLVLRPSAPRPLAPECPRFKFAHDEGRILVYRLVRQKPPLTVAAGDTITFYYPTDDEASNNAVPETTVAVYDISPPPAVTVGDSGLFGLYYVQRDSSLAPGYEFFPRGERADSISTFLQAFAADSAGTIAELQARHPGRKFRF